MSGFSQLNPVPVANGGTGNTGGAWTVTTPTVTPGGTPGTFAATASLHTLQEGKKVWVTLTIAVTNAGTATSMNVPIGTTALSSRFNIGGWGDSTGAYYSWAQNGSIYTSTGTTAPVVQNYTFCGSYEAA